MKNLFRCIHPIFGLLGFLGILGFFYHPMNAMLFGFFSFFFAGFFNKEKADERLIENYKKGMNIASKMALGLCFLMLYALSWGLSSETVLLWGSVGYGAVFTLGTAIAYFLDKRG
jgi:hypothetical protein